MELVKNIFFNTDRLTPNSTIKISYTGKFFQDASTDVYLHYGFGANWENVTDVKMVKSELGFQTELFLPETDSLCFCLKNEKDEWDNNDGSNYIFPIEHLETALVVQDEDMYSLVAPRKLRKSYIITKKVKIAIIKLIRYFPKIISGNYKRKSEE